MRRIQLLAQAKPYAVMLREKDLEISEYERLALQVKEICDRYGVLLILHQYSAVAEKTEGVHLHLSMADLRAYSPRGKRRMTIGASVHSVAETGEARELGAAYIVAGHIYATDCKKGIPPKGLAFLRQVCTAVNLPVYAIGGVAGNNVKEIMESGAKGFCVMAEAMICQDPAALVKELTKF